MNMSPNNFLHFVQALYKGYNDKTNHGCETCYKDLHEVTNSAWSTHLSYLGIYVYVMLDRESSVVNSREYLAQHKCDWAFLGWIVFAQRNLSYLCIFNNFSLQ